MICLRKYLKEYDAKDTPQSYYELLIMEKLINIFDWTGLPDGLESRDIEMYLQFTINSTCGIVPRKSGIAPYDCPYISVPLENTGDINVYNYGVDWIYNVPGQDGTVRQDETSVVIGWNNRGRISSRMLVSKYADLLEEVDKSLKIGIIRTRATKIFESCGDMTTIAIGDIMEAVKDGEYYTMFARDNFTNLVTGEKGTLKEYDLASNYTANDILALLQVRREIFSLLLMEIGIPIVDVPKKSQVNSNELKGYEDYALFTVYDMLEERRKMVYQMRTKLGWETANVDFSKFIKRIIKRSERYENKENTTTRDTGSSDMANDTKA